MADIKQAFPEINENFILEPEESSMFVSGGNAVLNSYVEGSLTQSVPAASGNPELLESLVKDLMDQNAALVAQVNRMLGLMEKLQTK